MRTKWKKRAGAGFTLAELLITVLILLMVSTILATGIPAASNAYEKVVDTANAQLLLSTTVTRLREELSTAVEVWVGDDGEVQSYSHSVNGYKISIVQDAADSTDKKGLTLQYALPEHAAEGAAKPADTPLVTDRTATVNKDGSIKFYVTFESISFDEDKGLFTVSNLEVRKADGTVDGRATFAKPITTLVIWPVMEIEPEPAEAPPAGG